LPFLIFKYGGTSSNAPVIGVKRRNKCSVCNALGHNKRNCPTNSNGKPKSATRAVRPTKTPENFEPPSLDEIGDDELMGAHETMSVDSNENSDAGESVLEKKWEGNVWIDCVVNDVELDDNGREILTVLPQFCSVY